MNTSATPSGARPAGMDLLADALAADDGDFGVAVFDDRMRCIALNTTAAAETGQPVDAHVGRTPSEIAPELGALIEPLLRRALNTGESSISALPDAAESTGHDCRATLHCQPLLVRGAEASAQPTLRSAETDAAGPWSRPEVWGVATVWGRSSASGGAAVGDLSESHLRRMADSAPVLLWSSGADGDRDWFNDVWLQWTGSTRGAALGRGWVRGVHPDDLEHCLTTYGDALARRQPFEVQYRLRRADGTYGWVLDRGTPTSGAGGELRGFLGSCTDITELKRRSHASAESLRRTEALQSVTAALSDATSQAQALAVVLHHAVPAVDADGGVVALLGEDGTEVEVLVSTGYRAAAVRSVSRFPLGAPLPLAKAIRERRPLRYGGNTEMLADNPGMSELIEPTVDRASLTVPMVLGSASRGALGLTWVAPHHADADHGPFLTAIAGQLAQALERIRLFDSEAAARRDAERAAKHLAFLANASRILGASLDLDLTLSRLASISAPYLADWCLIHLADEGAPRLVAVVHDDPLGEEALRRLDTVCALPAALVEGVRNALRTGATVRVGDFAGPAAQGLDLHPRYRRALAGLRFGDGLVVPLRHGTATLGTVAMLNDAGRALEPHTRNLAEELAVRAGAAVANARAFSARARVADQLQASLLPALLPVIPGVELGARYAAGDEHLEVGGDFYDAFALDDQHWLLVIGDVRGKGVQAAALTGLARHTIRAAALHHDRPAGILGDLNRVLLQQDAARDAGEPFGDPHFCTVCLMVVAHHADGCVRVTICSAGHPPPRLLRADRTVTEAATPGDLLGVLDAPAFGEHVVELGAGDALVALTDGITERRDGPLFFEDRIDEVLTAAGDAGAESLAERLIVAASAHASTAAADDMAVLTLRVTGPGRDSAAL